MLQVKHAVLVCIVHVVLVWFYIHGLRRGAEFVSSQWRSQRADMSHRMAIVSVNIGGYDAQAPYIAPAMASDARIDFLYFTDGDAPVPPPWRVVATDSYADRDVAVDLHLKNSLSNGNMTASRRSTLISKYFFYLAWRLHVLDGYRYFVPVSGLIDLRNATPAFYDEAMHDLRTGLVLVVPENRHLRDLRAEARSASLQERYAIDNVREQVRTYARRGFPIDSFPVLHLLFTVVDMASVDALELLVAVHAEVQATSLEDQVAYAFTVWHRNMWNRTFHDNRHHICERYMGNRACWRDTGHAVKKYGVG